MSTQADDRLAGQIADIRQAIRRQNIIDSVTLTEFTVYVKSQGVIVFSQEVTTTNPHSAIVYAQGLMSANNRLREYLKVDSTCYTARRKIAKRDFTLDYRG